MHLIGKREGEKKPRKTQRLNRPNPQGRFAKTISRKAKTCRQSLFLSTHVEYYVDPIDTSRQKMISHKVIHDEESRSQQTELSILLINLKIHKAPAPMKC